MRYGPDHKEAARQAMLMAVGGGFREKGFAGIGVDGLAKAAGVTSGAFYSHFKSKDQAFHQAVVQGFGELLAAIRQMKADEGNGWIAAFIRFYLSERLNCAMREACAFQALTPDIMRASPEVKAAYGACLDTIVAEVAPDMVGGDAAAREARALALLAFLSGAVTSLRALPDGARAGALATAFVPVAYEMAGLAA